MTFFLSSLADLESSSDSHFVHNSIDTSAVSLIPYWLSSFPPPTSVCACWKPLGVVLSLPTLSFPSGESRGSICSSWIVHERERIWISNSVLSLGLTCPGSLECFGPPLPHLENRTDAYLVGLCLEALVLLLVVLANDNVTVLLERRDCGWMFCVSVCFFAKHPWC